MSNVTGVGIALGAVLPAQASINVYESIRNWQ
jgi:hypothetical protein